nr:putative reverse transcriptase domain-containing protein [Tanacetum cinerariifolium]
MRRHKSSNNVTAAHQEGIMVLPQPQGKSSKPGSTCKISFMMHVDWAIPSSNGNKYILVAINYVSKWVKAQAFPASDARNVVNFLKILFVRFGISKALISDRDNYQMGRAMKRPFSVSKDMKNGAVVLYDENGNGFIVNKQHMRQYQKDASDVDKDDDITLEYEGEVT